MKPWTAQASLTDDEKLRMARNTLTNPYLLMRAAVEELVDRGMCGDKTGPLTEAWRTWISARSLKPVP